LGLFGLNLCWIESDSTQVRLSWVGPNLVGLVKGQIDIKS